MYIFYTNTIHKYILYVHEYEGTLHVNELRKIAETTTNTIHFGIVHLMGRFQLFSALFFYTYNNFRTQKIEHSKNGIAKERKLQSL